MSRFYKALLTIVLLVLLFQHAVERTVPSEIRLCIVIAIITYGISVFLGTSITVSRRLGMAYLAFAGLSYFITGLWGLLPNWGLLEAANWNRLVSPYPLISLLRYGIPRSPNTSGWAEIDVVPRGDHVLFSSLVVVVAAISVAAALLMAREWQGAYRVWLVLLCVFAASTLAYIVLAFAGWGLNEAFLPICWMLSYVLAYLLARGRLSARNYSKERASSSTGEY